MKTVKLTKFEIDEISHKLSIIHDEDDLLESYELSRYEAEMFCVLFWSLKGGQEVTLDQSIWDIITQEIELSEEAAHSNWKDCGDEQAAVRYRKFKALLKKLQ